MKKRKLNSKNPKYMDKSLLTKPKEIKRKLFCTTHHGCKVYGVWYENERKCYTRPDNLREFRGEVCARCVTETRVVGPKGNEFHETRYLTRMTLKY